MHYFFQVWFMSSSIILLWYIIWYWNEIKPIKTMIGLFYKLVELLIKGLDKIVLKYVFNKKSDDLIIKKSK